MHFGLRKAPLAAADLWHVARQGGRRWSEGYERHSGRFGPITQGLVSRAS